MGHNIQKSFLSNTVWNTLGSIVYFGCQWLITVIVVWLYDDFTNAGYLALAMSITNVFYCIAVYNIRAYQVSDVHDEFTDSEYILSRVLTCLGAIVLCAVFLLISGYSQIQILVVLSYMGFRTVEALVDVLHGIIHKHRRLDYAGVSMIARGLIMLASFSIFGWLFDLLPAIIIMTVTTLLFAVFYDISKIRQFAVFGKHSRAKLWALLKRCFPLMIVILIFAFYTSYTRYALERLYGTQALGGYVSAVTPAVAVQVAVQFLLAPLINLFADCIKHSNRTRFIKLFTVICAVITGFTLIATLAANFAGAWILALLFGDRISPYSYLLPGAVIASGLTAILWLMNVVFSTLRDIKGILIGTLIGIVVCVLSSEFLLRIYTLNGANYAMIITQGFVFVLLLIRFIMYSKKI